MADPRSVRAAIGKPQKGGIQTLYRSPDLTILNIVWATLMQLLPHEHRMWSVIGIYCGREAPARSTSAAAISSRLRAASGIPARSSSAPGASSVRWTRSGNPTTDSSPGTKAHAAEIRKICRSVPLALRAP